MPHLVSRSLRAASLFSRLPLQGTERPRPAEKGVSGRELGHVKSLPSLGRAKWGPWPRDSASGGDSRKPPPPPRPARGPPGRPAARRAGPAGSVLAAHSGSAGEAGAAPGPAPSPPGGCGWARAGHAFLRICCTGWGAHWGAAGVGRQFGKIKSRKRCQSRRGKGRPAVRRAPAGCWGPWQGRAEEGVGWQGCLGVLEQR